MQEESLVTLLEQDSNQIFSPFASTIPEISLNDFDLNYYQEILKQKQGNERKEVMKENQIMPQQNDKENKLIQQLLLKNKELNEINDKRLQQIQDLSYRIEQFDNQQLEDRKKVVQQYEELLKQREQIFQDKKKELQDYIYQLKYNYENREQKLRKDQQNYVNLLKQQISQQTDIINSYQQQIKKMEQEVQVKNDCMKSFLQKNESSNQLCSQNNLFDQNRKSVSPYKEDSTVKKQVFLYNQKLQEIEQVQQQINYKQKLMVTKLKEKFKNQENTDPSPLKNLNNLQKYALNHKPVLTRSHSYIL